MDGWTEKDARATARRRRESIRKARTDDTAGRTALTNERTEPAAVIIIVQKSLPQFFIL